MDNPIDAIKKELLDIEDRVRLAVETAMLRKAVRFELSRLMTIDPARSDRYNAALQAVGEM